MTDRVIDFSDEPAKLSVRNYLLIVEKNGEEKITIPLNEIAVLVVSHPQVIYTQSVLAGIASAGGTFITCDDKHVPVGMLLPIDAHFSQVERFAKQAQASEPTRKRLWQQLIIAKIEAQGNLLKEIRDDDFGLLEMAKKVKSGDTDNFEGQASRIYWPALFDDRTFTRERYGNDQNRFLNYGYTVLRATVARGICASGLHPSLGIHHHNKYDTFCLASDLMEPFRPIIDKVVVNIVDEYGKDAPVDKETKGALLSVLLGRFPLDGDQRTLFEIVSRTASSLAQVFTGERKDLVLPEI